MGYVNAQSFPSSNVPVPPGYKGQLFELSQKYPQSPVTDDQPWLKIDFKKDPVQYLQVVYDYILQGNLEVEWRLQDNAVRKWYHAPWMHYRMQAGVDMSREPLSGLTRERDSRPFELGPLQEKIYQNWAIGFYNPPGGYTLGQVWKDHQHPDPYKAVFPSGTVAGKLVMTEADSVQVPFLSGSPTLNAYVFRSAGDPLHRVVKQLHLLQFDIAVKDPRAASSSGWVYGTFIYQPDSNESNPWKRMLPVGLSWGNDAGYSVSDTASKKLSESFINPAAVHLYQKGWAGRMNGAIDNRNSSCHSCHGAASYPMLMSPAPDESMTTAQRMHWFNQTAKSNSTYFAASAPLDYSLQLAVGIQNLQDWNTTHEKRTVVQKIMRRLESWTYAQVLIPTLIIILFLAFYISRKPVVLKPAFISSHDKLILFLRIGVGVMMISHGLPKLLGGLSTWISLGQSMADFGLYNLTLTWGYLSMLAELLGGICICTGFCWRPVSFALICNMIVASSTHLFGGQGLQAASHALTLMIVFVFFFFSSPGRYSLDALIYNRK